MRANPNPIPTLTLTGALLVALFAQVGGGIYTKATDVLTLTQALTQTLTRWVAASTPRLPTWGPT